MEVRSLDQINRQLRSLGPTKAQERSINKRIGSLDADFESQKSGLLNDISTQSLNSARRRNLGFSGIPEREAAELSAPAIANLRSSFNDRRLSLEDALFGLQNQTLSQAIGIRESDLARAFSADEAQRARDFQAQQSALSRASQARATTDAAVNGILGKYGISLGDLPGLIGGQTQALSETTQAAPSLFDGRLPGNTQTLGQNLTSGAFRANKTPGFSTNIGNIRFGN